MTTQVFTWSPLVEPTGQTKFVTRVAQFGDGYSQSVPDGLNNKKATWPLTFAGSAAEVQPINDFLDALRGSTSFYWTPPLSTQRLFRCGDYSLKPMGGDMYTLSANFEEVFSP
jgi:phage-related protein